MTEELDRQTQQQHTDTPIDTQVEEQIAYHAELGHDKMDELEDASNNAVDVREATAETEKNDSEGLDTHDSEPAEEPAEPKDAAENTAADEHVAAELNAHVTDAGQASGTLSGSQMSPEEIGAITEAMASTVIEPPAKDEAANSAFVPGETPVADPGTAVPSFLQLEHPTIGADAVEPHTQGFTVIEGGTGSFEKQGALNGEAVANAAGEAPIQPNPGAYNQPEAPARSRDLGAAAADAAGAVGSFIAQGASAMREMNAAKKALSDARTRLEELDRAIADQAEELETRRDVAARYTQIVADQNAAIANAQKREAAAEIGRDAHAKKAAELKEALAQAKEEDATTEKRLKAAVDAAEAREANSRESGNRLTRRVEDARRIRDKAKAERDTGVAAAKQTITATHAQLETLRREYAELQRNPSANPANYTVRTNELSAQISDTADALRKAEEDLPRTTEDLEHALAAAEEALKQAEAPIADAKRAHQSVTDEADATRNDLQVAKEAATARQRELREKIAGEDKARREQEQAMADAKADAAHAQSLIDQATEVHEHPEVTEALAGSLARDRAERDEAAREVEQLEAAEHNVRERTRDSRIKFTGAIACIIAAVVVLAIIWLLATR